MNNETIQSAWKKFFLQRATFIMVLIFLVAGGISYRSEVGNFFNFGTGLRSSVTETEYYGLLYGFQQGNTLSVIATPDSGSYPKGDLYISLNISSAGDIRYAIDEIPSSTSSPLYPGRAINVYDPTSQKSEHTLNAIAIDGNLTVSKLFAFTYRFVPSPVTGLTVTSQSAGRVELIWDRYPGDDLKEYRVTVDDGDAMSASTHNAFTVSGLSSDEHRFTVSVVDNLGAESEKALVRAAPLPTEADRSHATLQEVSHDLNADGKVDVEDLKELLNDLSPSLEAIDAVVSWYKHS